MRVKDATGNVVNGILRTPSGGLLVNDVSGYHKYMRDKESTNQINQLKEEVDQLKQLVHKLLEKNNG